MKNNIYVSIDKWIEEKPTVEITKEGECWLRMGETRILFKEAWTKDNLYELLKLSDYIREMDLDNTVGADDRVFCKNCEEYINSNKRDGRDYCPSCDPTCDNPLGEWGKL